MNVFNTLTLKQIFWEKKSFFKKLEYYVLVESTKTVNASFPYKTKAISEANVKANRMVSTKWAYHKEWSFSRSYFIFFIICFSLRTSYKESIWWTNDPNVHIHTFRKHWSFIWECFFPVSILKNYEKCFLFHPKGIFDLTFWSFTFVYCKDTINFKIYDVKKQLQYTYCLYLTK